MTVIVEGQVYSGCRLIQRVSEGNFCEVWRAHSPAGQVAVKIACSPIGARMLAEEWAFASVLANDPKLRIVPITCYEESPTPHLVMPWIGTISFRTVLEQVRGGDDRPRALAQLIAVVETMSAIHSRHRLVHGDLKPENILIDREGRPLLTDFGLARETQSQRRSQALCHSMGSGAGLIGGTLAYLAPELVKGGEPSRAGDVYALGVMLHEVLLGHRPDKAIGPEALKPLLPDEAITVLMKALAFSPRDRHHSAIALRDHLRRSPELTVTGPKRWAMIAARYIQAGLAALFISMRYAAVLCLLSSYVYVGVKGIVDNPGWWIVFAPILVLHSIVRWEGPETAEEARLRRTGQVVGRG